MSSDLRGTRFPFRVYKSDDLQTADDIAGMCVQSAPASLLRSCTRRVPAREQTLEDFGRPQAGIGRPPWASEAREREKICVRRQRERRLLRDEIDQTS